MRKISLSNFTHLNKIKWRIFIPVQKAWYVKKIARGGWSGFGKALTWDPSQMITCHPKKIPKFLLKGGVVQFCLNSHHCHIHLRITVTKQTQIYSDKNRTHWDRLCLVVVSAILLFTPFTYNDNKYEVCNLLVSLFQSPIYYLWGPLHMCLVTNIGREHSIKGRLWKKWVS